jgi:NTP pyrophosphatase (non-canonical NTP hydrolase)
MYQFPRTKFVDENGIVGQLLHVASECMEATEAAQQTDIDHTAEEVMDILHSCETALRILQEKYGVNINKVARAVQRKNYARRYYL